jgi:transposase
MKNLPQPWSAAMEATLFTGWIYDHLKPQAAALKVAHRLKLGAIAAVKKITDGIDASKICDCLHVIHRFHGGAFLVFLNQRSR